MKNRVHFLIYGFTAFIVVSILLIFVNPMLFFGSSYKTQDILFRLKANSDVRIEYQMQDVGAFGYNRRTVLITPGLFFDSEDLVNPDTLNLSHWEKVDEYVNELELKGG